MKMRSLLGALASILLLTIVLGPGVATAADPVTLSASAFWQLHDGRHTAVSLQPSRTAGATPTVFVHVTQEFCDAQTDETVLRTFDAQTPIKGFFIVDRNIRSASLVTVVSGFVSEERLTSCAAPSGPPVIIDFGAARVALAAHWSGVGPITAVQPGIDARAARASGVLNGPKTLQIGFLGNTTVAELRRSSP